MLLNILCTYSPHPCFVFKVFWADWPPRLSVSPKAFLELGRIILFLFSWLLCISDPKGNSDQLVTTRFFAATAQRPLLPQASGILPSEASPTTWCLGCNKTQRDELWMEAWASALHTVTAYELSILQTWFVSASAPYCMPFQNFTVLPVLRDLLLTSMWSLKYRSVLWMPLLKIFSAPQVPFSLGK